jgi:hypothetical protein
MTNPRRMRRTVRKMRRYGMQPMVVINASDPLSDLVIVTLAHWLCATAPNSLPSPPQP